ncbi:7-carboxy-7-deazaguanine synthase QueE [Acidithiobacillus sp.]|uniref:7-carboxy-7-deazaguanine synthase QueE n=1 Tax=Acidithiobacillus sp. TaxID=1872118 RepID=UPI0025C247EC|nr:7-carboxy-7-deazaguanine synthase QueE [Acidithiobacillus sp.]
MSRLRVSEIFHSLQGETSASGVPATFVRLTGCPLRCRYCDTAYAFHGGEWLERDQVLARVAERDNRLVVVTGGEPLAQPAVHDLMTALCDSGREVYLETSGALSVVDVDPRVVKILDLKSPASGECDRNLWENLDYINSRDQLKFVLCDRSDYEWARTTVRERGLVGRCELLFSPAHGELSPRDLAEWILEDRLPVRLQIQLHKLIWGDVPGH